MANGGMGSQGLVVARLGRMAQRPLEVARALNHAVVATEWVARLILLLAGMLVLYYAADRKPPFELVSSAPASAAPGEYVTLRAVVRRDPERGCNAQYWRYVFDSRGARFDLGHSQASAEAIAAMERRSPGDMTLAFVVPPAAAPGPATLQTVLIYECNRVHHWWPIPVTIDMPFLVLP